MKKYLVTETKVFSAYVDAPDWGTAEEMFNKWEFDPSDTCNDCFQTVVTLNGIECNGYEDVDANEDDDEVGDDFLLEYYTPEEYIRYKAMSFGEQISELNRIEAETELAIKKESN